jgi:N-acetyl-anhydromuramyl-L-alanine amidase AmpD
MKPLNKVNFIVVHCADTKSNMNFTVEDLHRVHVVENGWSDIGYHHYIKFNGLAYECRSPNKQGAHCKAVNDKSLAICLEGGFGGVNNFTELQLDALYHLINKLKAKYPNAAIVGHNHFDDKLCPSFCVVSWYEQRVKDEINKAFGSFL